MLLWVTVPTGRARRLDMRVDRAAPLETNLLFMSISCVCVCVCVREARRLLKHGWVSVNWIIYYWTTWLLYVHRHWPAPCLLPCPTALNPRFGEANLNTRIWWEIKKNFPKVRDSFDCWHDVSQTTSLWTEDKECEDSRELGRHYATPLSRASTSMSPKLSQLACSPPPSPLSHESTLTYLLLLICLQENWVYNVYIKCDFTRSYSGMSCKVRGFIWKI